LSAVARGKKMKIAGVLGANPDAFSKWVEHRGGSNERWCE